MLPTEKFKQQGRFLITSISFQDLIEKSNYYSTSSVYLIVRQDNASHLDALGSKLLGGSLLA